MANATVFFFIRRETYLIIYLINMNKGNNKITELRTILQREIQNS
jgi:hypothetical protein